MANLETLKGDADKARDGIWVEHDLGFKFKLRRMPNPQYLAMRRRLIKPQTKRLRRGRIDLDAMDAITKECVAYCVLLDWQDVEEGGSKVAFTPQKALEIFKEPLYEDLYNFIVEEASDIANFAEEVEAEGEGNSQPSSTGT